MRSIDSNTLAALSSESLVLRNFVYVRGKTTGGAPVAFGFWNGEDDTSGAVFEAVDGATESRTYIGGGSLLDIGAIPSVIGLEVRTVSVKLSQIHPDVQVMVRANDIRHAVVEVHRGLFNVSTGQLVAAPYPRFLGKINAAPIETPSARGEGSITLKCVSNTRDLTRVNTAKKSDETQKLRTGDRFRRFAGVAKAWERWWGEAKGDKK